LSATYICNEDAISVNAANSSLNLGLSKFNGTAFANGFRFIQNISPFTSRPFIQHSNSNYTGCVDNFGDVDSKRILIRVTKSGQYNISVDAVNGFYSYYSVFSNAPYNCTSGTFIGSNSNSISSTYSRNIQLEECQLYHVIVYDDVNFDLNISGPGEVFEDISLPSSGTSYTYVAINQTTNKITDVSASSNFTSTQAGSYKIYGLMYANGFNANTLIGKNIEQAYGMGSCILFSNNSKPVTIISNPCATTLSLVNPADNISSGVVIKEAASGVGGKITATNLVSGNGTRATYTARAIELNEGFLADQGTVFRAEVGGCN
jgi:hypothetical protein